MVFGFKTYKMYQGYTNNCKIAEIFVFIVVTDDGYESHYQVNHLSPFLLTLELLPIIFDTAHAYGDARIVMVSSSLHAIGVLDPENVNGERNFGTTKFYGNSKLYNVSHTCYSTCIVYLVNMCAWASNSHKIKS